MTIIIFLQEILRILRTHSKGQIWVDWGSPSTRVCSPTLDGKTNQSSPSSPFVNFDCLKRRLSSGERWKIICERFLLLLCKCGRTSEKRYSRKSMALQMPSYSKYDMYHHILMPHVHLSVYSACNLYQDSATVPNFISFWWFQNLAVHTNTYMLHDQLQNSTLSLN